MVPSRAEDGLSANLLAEPKLEAGLLRMVDDTCGPIAGRSDPLFSSGPVPANPTPRKRSARAHERAITSRRSTDRARLCRTANLYRSSPSSDAGGVMRTRIGRMGRIRRIGGLRRIGGIERLGRIRRLGRQER